MCLTMPCSARRLRVVLRLNAKAKANEAAAMAAKTTVKTRAMRTKAMLRKRIHRHKQRQKTSRAKITIAVCSQRSDTQHHKHKHNCNRKQQRRCLDSRRLASMVCLVKLLIQYVFYCVSRLSLFQSFPILNLIVVLQSAGVGVDLVALSSLLSTLPLHQRLRIEPELLGPKDSTQVGHGLCICVFCVFRCCVFVLFDLLI